ncbi:hypothetical protein VTG60DRAFT_7385 [Thermothelomyces hinnuleus]
MGRRLSMRRRGLIFFFTSQSTAKGNWAVKCAEHQGHAGRDRGVGLLLSSCARTLVTFRLGVTQGGEERRREKGGRRGAREPNKCNGMEVAKVAGAGRRFGLVTGDLMGCAFGVPTEGGLQKEYVSRGCGTNYGLVVKIGRGGTGKKESCVSRSQE